MTFGHQLMQNIKRSRENVITFKTIANQIKSHYNASPRAGLLLWSIIFIKQEGKASHT